MLAKLLTPAVMALFLAGPCRAAEKADSGEAERQARVDALFSAHTRGDSPGCALGIFRAGRIVYAKGYGMANLDLRAPISPQTVFDIGSLAKQFTAFSIFLLERDGKLSLDDDLSKYLLELPAFAKKVTIRHLLHHTGGLRDYLELMSLGGIRTEDVTTERDALTVLAHQTAPLFPPGAEHLYSNTGYFLLGEIVKRVSGKSLRDFARERLFEPLGMKHTQYNDDHTRSIPNRATGYSPRPKAEDGFAIDMSNFEQNGDGGVLTNVEDLFLWDHNFANPRVGDRRTVEEMETPGKLNDGTVLDYAAGLRVDTYRGLRIVGHTGAWAGYRALLTRFPDQAFSVACLCNRSAIDRTELMHRIAAIYLGDLLKAEPPVPKRLPRAREEAPVAETSRLAGAYRDAESGAVLFLSVRDGQLRAELQGEKFTFQTTAQDRFADPDADLELWVHPGSASARLRLEVSRKPNKPRFFEKIDAASPSALQLADFAGDYRSDEVPGLLRFEVADGKLVLRHRVFPAEGWRPTLPDTFVWEDLTAEFTRGAVRAVEGMKLDAGRMRGIMFRKVDATPVRRDSGGGGGI